MQPLHTAASSLPALNGNDESNELQLSNQSPAAAGESESLSLAKNRFRSAVSKGVEVLSHHHGYSRKRAAAFILHHIRTCAVNSNIDSGKGDGDAMVPYSYPNDDEILQTMRKSGLGLDAAAQAVIVSHALKHVQSSQESVSSPIDAIHFLCKELSTMKVLTLVERTTSAIPMPEPFDFKYYGLVGVPEKELNMMAKVTSTSIPIVPLSKNTNIHSTPTRKNTSKRLSSSSSSSSCSKSATSVKKSKANPATGTGAGCPRPSKVDRKRPKESAKVEVIEKTKNTPADVNLNNLNVNVGVDAKQKKTETEVNAKLKVAEISQSLKSPSPAVTRGNKRANVNVESGQPVSKRQRLDSI